jgi:hypothetical protein
MSSMSSLVKVGLILLVLGVYWLPSIVARIRRHPDLVPIVVVNALLGWTVVGWVWAVRRNGSGARVAGSGSKLLTARTSPESMP